MVFSVFEHGAGAARDHFSLVEVQLSWDIGRESFPSVDVFQIGTRCRSRGNDGGERAQDDSEDEEKRKRFSRLRVKCGSGHDHLVCPCLRLATMEGCKKFFERLCRETFV